MRELRRKLTAELKVAGISSLRVPTDVGGFTFIEVLVAMAIFLLASLAAVNLANGSVKAVRDAKEVSLATWLLQQKMVELETKLESEGIEKACDKKAEGKFEKPNEDFRWTSLCNEIDFYIPESASAISKAAGDGEESSHTQQNQILGMILQIAGKYMTDSTRELHVEVHWKRDKTDRMVSATTHYAKYDVPFSLGGAAPTTDSSSDSTSTSSPSPTKGGTTP